MTSLQLLTGHAPTVLRTLPEASARVCVTSPPYWGLRDYGTGQWEGGEPDCPHRGRVKPRNDTTGAGEGHGRFSNTRGGQPAKSAYAVPVRSQCPCGARRIDHQVGVEDSPAEYVARLVEIFREVRRVLTPDGTLWLNLGDCYTDGGRGSDAGSTLEGSRDNQRESRNTTVRRAFGGLPLKSLLGLPWRAAFALQEDGWVLRQDIIWHKRNPMPESVRDRPTRAHEYLFLFAKQRRYYFNAAAIAEVSTTGAEARFDPGTDGLSGGHRQTGKSTRRFGVNPETRNARSVWTINCKPYKGAHFATFPEEIPRRCILAGSAIGDTVLDPFGGAGTTAKVALGLGRAAVHIDLKPAYIELARKRISPDVSGAA
ncbi:MAG TPA: site-specific DNA-methyltransferase [Reyranella sp.]|nr:site-specific DNA-methyltransferase [Reyranella sp.]